MRYIPLITLVSCALWSLAVSAQQPPAGGRGRIGGAGIGAYPAREPGDPSGNFVAFDPASGKPLWNTRLTANVSNAPQTYLVDGKQHVLVAAGETLYAFSLY